LSQLEVTTESGCPLNKGLERINGINFKEFLVIKHLKEDISEKSFLAREVIEAIGK
jgi:hypothetical protein